MRKMLQLVGYQRKSYWSGIQENLNIFVHVVGLLGVLWVGCLLLEMVAR